MYQIYLLLLFINDLKYFFGPAFDKKDGPLTQEEEEQRGSIKRKMLGNIRFIGMDILLNTMTSTVVVNLITLFYILGELAKLDMLHETILHKCIKQVK